MREVERYNSTEKVQAFKEFQKACAESAAHIGDWPGDSKGCHDCQQYHYYRQGSPCERGREILARVRHMKIQTAL